MTERRLVMATPEIVVDGLLGDKCATACDWYHVSGVCLLFNQRRLPTDQGLLLWNRLDECHAAEQKYDRIEEGQDT